MRIPTIMFLAIAAVATAVAGPAAGLAQADSTMVLTGHITSEQPDWVYVPFDVPPGTNRG